MLSLSTATICAGPMRILRQGDMAGAATGRFPEARGSTGDATQTPLPAGASEHSRQRARSAVLTRKFCYCSYAVLYRGDGFKRIEEVDFPVGVDTRLTALSGAGP